MKDSYLPANCALCGQPVLVHRANLGKHNHFCDKICQAGFNYWQAMNGIGKSQPRNCDNCNKIMIVRKTHLAKYDKHYCSRACSDDGLRVEKAMLKCEFCGKDYEKYMNKATTYTHNFCSNDCTRAFVFAARSKRTTCIKCDAKLKVGEGWATPLKKRKDYICDKCKATKKIQKNRDRLKGLIVRLDRYGAYIERVSSGDADCIFCRNTISRERLTRGLSFCGGKKCSHKAQHKRVMASPKERLNSRMRTAVGKALRRTKNGRAWAKLVGYDASELKKSLEKKFLPGMTWENMGEWHIDHVVPKSAFNYQTTSDPDFQRCWAIDNLQPLWARDNLSKSDRLDEPFQPQLAGV